MQENLTLEEMIVIGRKATGWVSDMTEMIFERKKEGNLEKKNYAEILRYFNEVGSSCKIFLFCDKQNNEIEGTKKIWGYRIAISINDISIGFASSDGTPGPLSQFYDFVEEQTKKATENKKQVKIKTKEKTPEEKREEVLAYARSLVR